MRIRPFFILPVLLMACAHAGERTKPEEPVPKPPGPSDPQELTPEEEYRLRVQMICQEVQTPYHLKRIYHAQAEMFKSVAAVLFRAGLEIEVDVLNRMEARDADPEAVPLTQAEREAMEEKLRWMRARLQTQAIKVLAHSETVYPEQRQAETLRDMQASGGDVASLQRNCRESYDAGLALAVESDNVIREVMETLERAMHEFGLEKYARKEVLDVRHHPDRLAPRLFAPSPA